MKLLNYTQLYISATLFLALGIWAALFYKHMLAEVYDSLDDGLTNYKILIEQKLEKDPSILQHSNFDERNYLCTKTSDNSAPSGDSYKDTLLFTLYEQDWEPYRMLTTVVQAKGQFYQFKIICPMAEEDDLIDELTYSLWGLYAALLICILLLNNYLLRWIWKPFYYLLDQLKNYRLGQPKPTFAPTRIDEFKALNATVSSLLDSSERAYDNQKQFIENAAHELQTPLAISLNKLELLAEKNELSEEGIALLGGAMQSIERLFRLNKSLLLLSKIENKQFLKEEEIDFKDLLIRSKEEFSDLADYKNIQINIQQAHGLRFTMNRDLAEIMVGNLLKNALVHSAENGQVEISSEQSSFFICNPSFSNQALNKEKLFTRFYKESQEKTSTGLGLAIVKAIADLYDLRVDYSFDSYRHCFSISIR